jgi:predicted unusual protein kinase regulating ubiquinone biosynthesis (AarF/ABC1/UbiB family)
MMGLLLPHADLELLEKAEAKAFERFWGKSMAELREISLQEMHEFAHEFRELVYTMPFQLPQDMILLGRTIAILSGMCTGLNPQFNLWGSIAPYAQKLLSEEVSGGWRFWLDELGVIARALLALPRQAESVLGKMERGELAVQVPQLVERVNRLERAVLRLTGGTMFVGLLTAGVQVYLAGQVPLGTGLLVAAGIVLAWIILPRRAKR